MSKNKIIAALQEILSKPFMNERPGLREQYINCIEIIKTSKNNESLEAFAELLVSQHAIACDLIKELAGPTLEDESSC